MAIFNSWAEVVMLVSLTIEFILIIYVLVRTTQVKEEFRHRLKEHFDVDVFKSAEGSGAPRFIGSTIDSIKYFFDKFPVGSAVVVFLMMGAAMVVLYALLKNAVLFSDNMQLFQSGSEHVILLWILAELSLMVYFASVVRHSPDIIKQQFKSLLGIDIDQPKQAHRRAAKQSYSTQDILVMDTDELKTDGQSGCQRRGNGHRGSQGD